MAPVAGHDTAGPTAVDSGTGDADARGVTDGRPAGGGHGGGGSVAHGLVGESATEHGTGHGASGESISGEGVAGGAALLRFAAVGSVDDGKSTLIGRLLHDTKQLFEDQLQALSSASRRRGVEGMDLSFVTDGLRAEREQGITIDVAYRYAATPRRKFVIADCPGHVQYTRNMATGASTADLAVVVVDVTSGLREQTRRHCCIATLMGVRSWIVAVNKMDLVAWDRQAYERVAGEMAALAARLGATEPVVVPVSALAGDNVVEPSDQAPWYRGPTVLRALEDAPAGTWASGAGNGARLAVQWVLRRPGGGRDYAGMVSGGVLRPGDAVAVLPGGGRTTIREISTFDGPLDAAVPPMSVTVTLADDLDVSRGDMITPTAEAPEPQTQVEATVCWFASAPLTAGQRYQLKHTTRVTAARIVAVDARLDVGTMTLVDAAELGTNDIGVAHLETAVPLVADPYPANRVTGSFVLIDEATHATVAAGLVGRPPAATDPAHTRTAQEPHTTQEP
ncbi:MAG: GTP-binding protein, partial [Actinomycetota bacterium]|nr:GTP-binding protein [Actinomycetota bacterium]